MMGYSYDSSAGYNFELFEEPAKKNQAAPKPAPRVLPKTAPKAKPGQVKKTQKPVAHRPKIKKVYKLHPTLSVKNLKVTMARIGVFVFLGVSVIVFFSLVISSAAQNYTYIRSIAKAQAEIRIQRSENVRLNTALNAKVGVGKIDDYAENVLGMVKVERYQARYIDLTKGDSVLYAKESALEKIIAGLTTGENSDKNESSEAVNDSNAQTNTEYADVTSVTSPDSVG